MLPVVPVVPGAVLVFPVVPVIATFCIFFQLLSLSPIPVNCICWPTHRALYVFPTSQSIVHCTLVSPKHYLRLRWKTQGRWIQKNIPRVQMMIKNDNKGHLLLLLTFSGGWGSGCWPSFDIGQYVDCISIAWRLLYSCKFKVRWWHFMRWCVSKSNRTYKL
jgi:hypothetical protein